MASTALGIDAAIAGRLRCTSGGASTRPTAKAAAITSGLAPRAATGTRLQERSTLSNGTRSNSGSWGSKSEKSITKASWSKKSGLSPCGPNCRNTSAASTSPSLDLSKRATNGSCALLISKEAGTCPAPWPAEETDMKKMITATCVENVKGKPRSRRILLD